jgi:hypothetical protein
MKSLLNSVGIVLVLSGSIFFLQGINVLPGSFMTGDPQWAINGAVMFILGAAFILWASRRR